MLKPTMIILLLLCALCSMRVLADGKKKKLANPMAWSPYSCCHRLDDTAHNPGTLVENHFVPDFYYPDTVYKRDTAYAFVCYDQRDSVIDADTVLDFSVVGYMSLFKIFTDSTHTYRDNGRNVPLPIATIVHRYDRLGPDRWNSIAYPGNQYSELKEYRNEMVRTDSVIEDYPHLSVICIYQYYKTK